MTSSNKRPKTSADEQKLEPSFVGRGNDFIGTRGLLAFNGYVRERYCDTGERNEFCRDDKNIFRLYMYIPPFLLGCNMKRISKIKSVRKFD